MSSGSKIEISTELLRTLHRTHRQRSDLNGQLQRGPLQIKAGEAIVAKAQSDLGEARETLKRARIASDEKQLQLKSRELRIEGLEAKLNVAASNREFSTLKEQIAADKQANSVLSDEILEALEQLDELEAQVAVFSDGFATAQSEHEIRVRSVEEKMVTQKEDLARVEALLADSEAKIPSAARTDYDRLTAAKGEDALAPVDAGSCGGCYQTLTTQYIDRLQLSRLIRCPNCNAFLYLPEDHVVG